MTLALHIGDENLPAWWYDFSYNPLSTVILLLLYGTISEAVKRK